GWWPNFMIENKVVLVFYIFTFLTGLPSNLLACYALLRKVWQKPIPIDILLLNLTLSDLFLLLFLPFKMVETAWDGKWILPWSLCHLTNFCFYSSCYISTLSLTGVSVERYLCTAYPAKYKSRRKPPYAIAASLFFWLVACSHCSAIYITEYHQEALPIQNLTTCYKNFSVAQLQLLLPIRLELCLMLFCLPFLITFFCYVKVIRILLSMPSAHPQRKKRAVGLAVFTLLNFAICFGPFNISHIVGFIENASPSWRRYAFLLSSFNATLDPAIFYFSSTTIQQAFADWWLSMRSRLSAVVSCGSLPSCTAPGDKEASAGRLPGSGFSFDQTSAYILTEASFAHKAATLEVRMLGTLESAGLSSLTKNRWSPMCQPISA
uniref:G-protein coupled receptors family 1 profile domain-containing protein n=1 Tax=Varanus komodoensis TaxID=61221 RepID=A0A8D2JAW4_VARKO